MEVTVLLFVVLLRVLGSQMLAWGHYPGGHEDRWSAGPEGRTETHQSVSERQLRPRALGAVLDI